MLLNWPWGPWARREAWSADNRLPVAKLSPWGLWPPRPSAEAPERRAAPPGGLDTLLGGRFVLYMKENMSAGMLNERGHGRSGFLGNGACPSARSVLRFPFISGLRSFSPSD